MKQLNHASRYLLWQWGMRKNWASILFMYNVFFGTDIGLVKYAAIFYSLAYNVHISYTFVLKSSILCEYTGNTKPWVYRLNKIKL